MAREGSEKEEEEKEERKEKHTKQKKNRARTKTSEYKNKGLFEKVNNIGHEKCKKYYSIAVKNII